MLADARFLTEAGLPDLDLLSLTQEASGRWRLDGTPDGGQTGMLARFDLRAPAVIEGTEAGERLIGTAAAEDILGLGGNDILISGGGDDLLRGGPGGDFFAFQRLDDGATARIADFGAGDRLALDDRFFGLGDAGISPRALSGAEASAILAAGQAQLNLGAGRLTLDPAGPGGDGPALTIDLGTIIGISDVFLF
ncbi:hypothetical protein [Jannaschia seohaensis]|uniref:Hemolysin type calcium-binding protein n=1 Tax=Jannaschia seohaensis TaxID=475081 RepID=A0A2Y9B8V2_9RHOB|nr:hypothetical protein [Jannaschia seohaensis]PWJ09939.1 hypothetical protein BCF38_12712 [Jannaschia seohaensis]SSA51918.1 hypothetical protein SAMN05421539_12712 [Jannaschia seohaensis]